MDKRAMDQALVAVFEDHPTLRGDTSDASGRFVRAAVGVELFMRQRRSPTDEERAYITARAAVFTRNLTVEELRRAFEQRTLCDDGCPGWAVFSEPCPPHVEVCDACWYGHANAPTDAEALRLPEAQAALKAVLDDPEGWTL